MYILNKKGQLTLFFATSFLIFITCIAFMVNVGLFVKAKINLQNAVDAAAFSGAATQARQLSNIAYVNWAMRNVYKEWMFKTYVIGQLWNEKTLPATGNAVAAAGPNMDFRMIRFNKDDPAGDFYNIPSTCLHIGGNNQTANICARFTVPGIPRFASLGMVGTDATLTSFTDSLVQSKSTDCAKRTELNFMVANCWAFQTGQGEKLPNTPNVSCDRVGAWPKAFELALRIRNLEKIMNAPPESNICLNGSDCKSVSNLYSGTSFLLPVKERTVKAFWSAYRNLETMDSAINLKQTFKLTELSPSPVSVDKGGMGGMMTKSDGPLTKYYVDLRIFLINFVSFFHVFAGEPGVYKGTATEGQCGVSKLAIPVPGYPLGFYKNPEVLTYYAVEGKAQYTGLFNPFAKAMNLVAYAAAKPFGGRIGPMLFLNRSSAEDQIFARPAEGSSSPKSYPYASSLDTKTSVPGFPLEPNINYKRGYPVPLTQKFWVLDETTMIGGNPGSNSSIGFAIPNLLYDFNINANDLAKQSAAFIQKIMGGLDVDDSGNITATKEGAGLYDRKQYQTFQGNMPEIYGLASGTQSATLSAINNALERMSSPTNYELLNYLIPNGYDANGQQPIAPATVVGEAGNHPIGGISYTLFAPLKGQDTYFNTDADVEEMFNTYINTNKSSIEKFLSTLQSIAYQIHQDGLKSPTDQTTLDSAAKSFHENYTELNPSNPRNGLTDCNLSMAGKFSYFFFGPPPTCVGATGANIETLQKSIFTYWNKQPILDPTFNTHLRMVHIGPYDRSVPNNFQKLPEKTIMSAYFPGVQQGAQINGMMPLPNGGPVWPMDRNYYSTKFVAVESLSPGSTMSFIPSPNNFTIFSEGSTQIPQVIKIENFRNKLNTNIPISTIKQ